MDLADKRSIRQVITAMKVNMGGIILDQALPQRGLDQIDPFLLVHHLAETYKAGTQQHKVGVPPHPHRGFAPVSFIFQGGVHHRDSTRISSVIEAGGTQWMHSGKGIVHSERPSQSVVDEGGTMELIQFWVNVPAKDKMTDPFYVPLTYEDTPKLVSEDCKVEIGVVAGKLHDKTGPVKTHSPILALRLVLAPGGKIRIPVPATYNAFVYQLDGALRINGRETQSKDLSWLANDGEIVEIEALDHTRAILLSGEPIAEPIATYGPFVMNTQSEILEAMRDYQAGKMGILNEQFD
jgi:redox-sensitive bicupin YhaK (pirin superfamily)